MMSLVNANGQILKSYLEHQPHEEDTDINFSDSTNLD